MKAVFFALLLSLCSATLNADDGPTLAEGQAAIQAQDFVGAAMILEVVTTREPQNALAWQLFGYALHAQGRIEEALAAHAKTAGFAKLFPSVLKGAALFVEKPRILYTLVGEAAGDQFGWVARPVDDLDGDGVLDFAATAPSHATGGVRSGRVYVYSGRAGKLLFSVDGKTGYSLGNSVAPAGDVNADGTPDLIAGAPGGGGNRSRAGTAYVYSGKDGSQLATYTSKQPGDTLGFDAVGIGDVDGDGGVDFLLTSAWSPALGPQTGRVFVIAGPTFGD